MKEAADDGLRSEAQELENDDGQLWLSKAPLLPIK